MILESIDTGIIFFYLLSHQEKKRLRKKFHGVHSDKYIIGCVNANNSSEERMVISFNINLV